MVAATELAAPLVEVVLPQVHDVRGRVQVGDVRNFVRLVGRVDAGHQIRTEKCWKMLSLQISLNSAFKIFTATWAQVVIAYSTTWVQVVIAYITTAL